MRSHRQEDHGRADHRGPEKARVAGERDVGKARRGQAGGNHQVSRCMDDVRSKRDWRERKPDQDWQQDVDVVPRDLRPGAIGVGADDEDQCAQDADELRQSVYRVVRFGVGEAMSDQEGGDRAEGPRQDPEADVQAAPVEVEQEKQPGDEQRRTAEQNTRIQNARRGVRVRLSDQKKSPRDPATPEPGTEPKTLKP